jgi:hypothetical protein
MCWVRRRLLGGGVQATTADSPRRRTDKVVRRAGDLTAGSRAHGRSSDDRVGALADSSSARLGSPPSSLGCDSALGLPVWQAAADTFTMSHDRWGR